MLQRGATSRRSVARGPVSDGTLLCVVTLSDVAKAAGVSLSTASRAINGSKDRTVNAALRDRVLAAAAELRYAPNAAAQAIARGRSSTLSLIVHDITDPYFSSIAAGVSRAARAAGSTVILGIAEHDPNQTLSLIEAARSHRSQALIIVGGLRADDAGLTQLQSCIDDYRRSTGAGVAIVGQGVLDVAAVAPANREGSVALAKALTAQGFRTYAILTGPADHLTARDRAEGFAEGLDGSGEVVKRVDGDFTRDGGYAAMTELLESGSRPDVVFAVNDVMAVGALAAAREAGLSVPGDIRVAGFDDIPTLRDIVPSLTTVRVPLERIGEFAVSLALGETSLDESVTQEYEVVLRDSTG
ncbi:MAG: LacI family DNA-binding transcriptional regulator [Actinobacteria bacterium]|nr:LacI family DNA-binding transcriptional regulator [Actinomycetota bacterium]